MTFLLSPNFVPFRFRSRDSCSFEHQPREDFNNKILNPELILQPILKVIDTKDAKNRTLKIQQLFRTEFFLFSFIKENPFKD